MWSTCHQVAGWITMENGVKSGNQCWSRIENFKTVTKIIVIHLN